MPVLSRWNEIDRIDVRIKEIGPDLIGQFIDLSKPTPDGRGTYRSAAGGAMFYCFTPSPDLLATLSRSAAASLRNRGAICPAISPNRPVRRIDTGPDGDRDSRSDH